METAHTPPDDQPTETTALSFTVHGNWGHFRRVDKTTVKQTYRVIPRPTVAGLIAALLGWDRDSYYSHFDPETTRIAIAPESMVPADHRVADTDLSTQAIPFNETTVEKSDVDTAGAGLIHPRVSVKGRQQRHREYVRDPAYRIFVTSSDQDLYNPLKSALEENSVTYSPSLGKAECLAQLTYHGETAVHDATGETVVNSTLRVSDVDPAASDTTVDTSCEMERTPYHMEAHGNGRRTTGFIQYAFSTTAPVACSTDTPLATVNGLTVQFQ